MKKAKSLLPGSSIFIALISSLCCITPVLTLIAGASGWAATFSWLEPVRPYLAGVTLLVLGTAWYGKLTVKKQPACNCATAAKPAFTQTKTFLGIITIAALVMLAFPYYAHIFYPQTEKQVVVADRANIQTTRFAISGMTCRGCEALVDHELSKMNGIVKYRTSYEKASSVVTFDGSKITADSIVKVINEAGYRAIPQTETKN